MTKDLFSRPRCWFMGCRDEAHIPCCHYCGEDLYEGFLHYGKLEPLFVLCWRVRKFIRNLGPKRCDQGGKKFVKGYDDYLCSEECHELWLPF